MSFLSTKSSQFSQSYHYAILMETNGSEHESWYNFIRVEGNEDALAHLRDHFSKIDFYILDELSTFDLEDKHTVSEQTAREMCKVDLNSVSFHRKFDGKLAKIDFEFSEYDENDDLLEKINDKIGMGDIDQYIDDEDLCDSDYEYSDDDDDKKEESSDDDGTPPRRSKKEVTPPRRSKKEDTPPRRSKKEDTPPRRSKKEDTPPRRSKKEDTPPTRSKKEDTQPTRSKKEDTQPTRSKKEDTPPTRSKKEDTPPTRSKKDDTQPTRSKKEDTQPTRSKKEDTPPRRSKKEDSR